jgi:hypothetical protein
MKITFARSYKKSNGKIVFVYHVHGDQAQLKQFEAIQGDNHRLDENDIPVFFTPRYVGETATLIVTKAGKLVPDTSEFDKINSLVSQYGGNLGQAMANQFAGKLTGMTMPVPQVTPEPEA